MSRKTEPVSLGAAIEALVRSLGIGGKLKEYEIVEVWPGIVGERIAQISHVESVERGVAIISRVHLRRRPLPQTNLPRSALQPIRVTKCP